MASWKVLSEDQLLNPTTLAAGSIEKIGPGMTRGIECNFLEVTNRDAVPIQVRLDGDDTRVREVAANSFMTISPDEGILFRNIAQKNVHAATAEVASTILFRWGKSIRVGA